MNTSILYVKKGEKKLVETTGESDGILFAGTNKK